MQNIIKRKSKSLFSIITISSTVAMRLFDKSRISSEGNWLARDCRTDKKLDMLVYENEWYQNNACNIADPSSVQDVSHI